MAKQQKRDTSILVKVSETEKSQIVKNAAEFGGSISEFARHQMLHGEPSDGRQLQAIASEFCRLAQLINKIESRELREAFVQGEKRIWQSIK